MTHDFLAAPQNILVGAKNHLSPLASSSRTVDLATAAGKEAGAPVAAGTRALVRAVGSGADTAMRWVRVELFPTCVSCYGGPKAITRRGQ